MAATVFGPVDKQQELLTQKQRQNETISQTLVEVHMMLLTGLFLESQLFIVAL